MKKFLKDESGQTILEYALIIAVLVLVIIAAIPQLSTAVKNVFKATEQELTPPTPPTE